MMNSFAGVNNRAKKSCSARRSSSSPSVASVGTGDWKTPSRRAVTYRYQPHALGTRKPELGSYGTPRRSHFTFKPPERTERFRAFAENLTTSFTDEHHCVLPRDEITSACRRTFCLPRKFLNHAAVLERDRRGGKTEQGGVAAIGRRP
jgi:hypothetical protein